MKKRMENICSFGWPVLEGCKKDYDQQCPKLWVGEALQADKLTLLSIA